MNRRLLACLLMIVLATTGLAQRPRSGIADGGLLATEWGGSSPFNALAPDGAALGCHAVAFAQVLFFHRLAPSGRVSYRCSDGTEIVEDLAAYRPRWDAFALKGDATDAQALRETCRFLYQVAAVVRKDFGTDRYVDYPDDAHKQAIESHFDCTLTSYERAVTTGVGEALRDGVDLQALLAAEIAAGRPAGFYYTSDEDDGHAVVIDGCAERDGEIFFHVNFGWQGRSDGWYSMAEDLPPSTTRVMVIAIVPDPGNR